MGLLLSHDFKFQEVNDLVGAASAISTGTQNPSGGESPLKPSSPIISPALPTYH